MDCDFDLVYPMQKTFEMENKFVCKFDIDLLYFFDDKLLRVISK